MKSSVEKSVFRKGAYILALLPDEFYALDLRRQLARKTEKADTTYCVIHDLVRSFEEKGLIKRVPKTRGRKNIYVLTEKGREIRKLMNYVLVQLNLL